MVHQYTCSQCEFMVRSADDDEVVAFVQQHADDAHDMRVAADDVRAGWAEAGTQD